MFGKRRAGNGKTSSGSNGATPSLGALGRGAEQKSSAPGPVAAPPEPPRRAADFIAPAARRADSRPALGDGRKLIVGRDISLAGEIRAADRLVVEGRVAANLVDCSTLEIAAGGLFHGSAVVKVCEVAGSFEGELTATERLIVRSGGRVNGRINYGEIEIERGGRIGGAVELRDVGPRPLSFRNPSAEALAREVAARNKPNGESAEPRGKSEAEAAQSESALT